MGADGKKLVLFLFPNMFVVVEDASLDNYLTIVLFVKERIVNCVYRHYLNFKH